MDFLTKFQSCKSFLKKLLNTDAHKWKNIPSILLRPVGGLNIFLNNLQCSPKDFARDLSKFDHNMAKNCNSDPQRIDDICSLVIWNNHLILSDGRPIFNHNLSDKVSITVSELLSEYLQFPDCNQAIGILFPLR